MNLELFRRRYQLQIANLKGAVSEHLANPSHKARLEILILDLERVLDVTEQTDLIPHTIFREPIASREDAERLFRYLHAEGLLFHPEDDPADCIGDRITADDARELRHRINEAYDQDWSEYDCPCGFCLTLGADDGPPAITGTVMREAAALLKDLSATFIETEHALRITTATHEFGVNDADYTVYSLWYERTPATRRIENFRAWLESDPELPVTATPAQLAEWIREQINTIQLKDTAELAH